MKRFVLSICLIACSWVSADSYHGLDVKLRTLYLQAELKEDWGKAQYDKNLGFALHIGIPITEKSILQLRWTRLPSFNYQSHISFNECFNDDDFEVYGKINDTIDGDLIDAVNQFQLYSNETLKLSGEIGVQIAKITAVESTLFTTEFDPQSILSTHKDNQFGAGPLLGLNIKYSPLNWLSIKGDAQGVLAFMNKNTNYRTGPLVFEDKRWTVTPNYTLDLGIEFSHMISSKENPSTIYAEIGYRVSRFSHFLNNKSPHQESEGRDADLLMNGPYLSLGMNF